MIPAPDWHIHHHEAKHASALDAILADLPADLDAGLIVQELGEFGAEENKEES